jgi:hypothetical protein
MPLPTGFQQVLLCVEEDFEQRLPGYHKSRRGGFALYFPTDFVGLPFRESPYFTSTF